MKLKSILRSGLGAAALLAAGTGFTAPQSSNSQPPPPPPLPPILSALDANNDGVIDADEIAAASKVLAALDTNSDGALSLYELLLPPLAGGKDPSSTPDASPSANASPSATPDAWSQGVGSGHKSKSHSRSQNGPPPPQLSMMAALRLVAALDVNQDYFVDADEIKNASQALLKLDKNGDGKLTAEELQNPPPMPPDGGQQRGQNTINIMPGGLAPGNMPPPPPPGGRR